LNYGVETVYTYSSDCMVTNTALQYWMFYTTLCVVNLFGPSAQTFASISTVGKDIKLMLPSCTASHMKYLECQNALFYNKMWDHAQAFKLNHYGYTVN